MAGIAEGKKETPGGTGTETEAGRRAVCTQLTWEPQGLELERGSAILNVKAWCHHEKDAPKLGALGTSSLPLELTVLVSVDHLAQCGPSRMALQQAQGQISADSGQRCRPEWSSLSLEYWLSLEY
jgi:hypothetical protein